MTVKNTPDSASGSLSFNGRFHGQRGSPTLEMYEDPASYAASCRSRGQYRLGAIIEQHLGERRCFYPHPDDPKLTMAISGVKRIPWKIPDCRRCNDLLREDYLMYAAEIEVPFFAELHEKRCLKRIEERWSNPKTLAQIEQRLAKALQIQ